MPSLFHRRTRSASAQRPQQATSNSAHMAATQAFLANRVSQGNLSASAAAAALRAMSPPPTPVADVQTKRMQRRSSSASGSPANASRGRSRGGLDRTSSSGSMTERTFRSPSPGRPTTPSGPGVAPPVPQLPADIPPVPKLPDRSSKRSLSLDTYASKKQNPTPQHTPANDPQSISKAAAAISVGQHAQVGNGNVAQRADSRNSVNFSRPLSPSPQSPASPVGGQRSNRNGISGPEAENVQYSVTAAAQQPVKKKKKKVAPRSSEGSHLQSGSMASRPVSTPLAPDPEIPPVAAAVEPKEKKKKVALTGQSSHFPQSSDAASSNQESDSSPEHTRRAQRAAGHLAKQPSIVREDWEGEQEQQLSEAQEREQQGLSPVASPAATVQSKKLTAANMSRKIEEPITPTPKSQPSPLEAYQDVTEAPAEAGTSHLTVQQPQVSRNSSISPSRSTRFSEEPSDLAAGRKHEPLPRSVSPVKSALKHHHPSTVDDRLSKPRGSSATPSDASDSNRSADGSVRRQKSVRVSFEPEPEVVGVAAEPQSTDSPVIQSPQAKETKKRGFFGLGSSKPALTTIPSEDNLDEHMQPRPQLPSFGSIRNRQRRVDSSDSVEVAPTADKLLSSPSQISSTSSDGSSSPDIPAQDQGSSSDHAIGAILSRNAAQKSMPQDPLLPLPPVVTSVEGGGYMSDTESDITVEEIQPQVQSSVSAEMPNGQVQSTTTQPPQTMHQPSDTKAAEEKDLSTSNIPTDVPALSVQPPTPGIEDEKPSDQWLVEVPGGFPSAPEEMVQAVPQATTPSTNASSNPSSEARKFGPSEAELRKAQAAPEEEESASDGDSIYSDAEEDLSDREGYGSIDAIVESPIIESPRLQKIQTPPQSPLAERTDRPQAAERTASWDDTQQHWSGIAQQSRQVKAAPLQKTPQPATEQLPQPAPQRASQQATQRLQTVTTPTKPKKKKKSSTTATAGALAAAVPVARPPPVDRTQPTSMRSSMRQPAAPQASNNEAGAMRTSMRQTGNAPNPRGLQASKWATEPTRPTPPPQPVAAPASPGRAALQKKYIPPANTAPTAKPAYKPPPPPTINNSDSDSSFKKARRSKKSADGSYNMRRSMRSAAQAPPTQPGGRGAVRSLSPPVRRPFSPAGDQRPMRTSMRGSIEAAAPTLRGPKEQKRSSSLFGKRKAKSPMRAGPMPLTAGLRSRIGDSDDEDGPRPTSFRSRFEDSSDEEGDPQPLRPVRGIPRRHDEGDSTDLDDSSDEEKKKSRRQLQPAIKIDTTAAQQAGPAADAPLSPTTMKKRGLFSRFRSKKEDKGSSPKPRKVNTAADPIPDSRPGTKDDDTPFDGNMGFGSSAERDAMIRQTMAKLEAAKQDQDGNPPDVVSADPGPASSAVGSPASSKVPRPTSPVAGKLQRRRPERVMSDSWPLPDVQAKESEDRPSTSAGPGSHKTNGMSSLRPALHERKPTNETLSTDGGSPLTGSKSKKKRFPMLRKAFGLKS